MLALPLVRPEASPVAGGVGVLADISRAPDSHAARVTENVLRGGAAGGRAGILEAVLTPLMMEPNGSAEAHVHRR